VAIAVRPIVQEMAASLESIDSIYRLFGSELLP